MLLDKASSKGKFALKILAVFLICAADMLFAAWVIYAEKQKGTLLSVRAASSHLPQLFAQNLLTSAVPAFLVFLALVFCKKRFVQAMQLTVPKGKTRKIAVLLLFLLLIVTAAALIVKPDKITVLYSLFYYTVFIAFCEEFVVRGVCVGLLRDEPAAVRYLVPNHSLCRHARVRLCGFRSDHRVLPCAFCMLTNGGACRHGLPFPIPQRKIRLPVDPRPRARRFRLHSRVRLLKIPRSFTSEISRSCGEIFTKTPFPCSARAGTALGSCRASSGPPWQNTRCGYSCFPPECRRGSALK